MKVERVARTIAAALSVVATVVVALATHHHAPLDLLAAVGLAVLASVATARAATRIGGSRFGTAASFVYPCLPVLGNLYALPTFRHAFVHQGLPQALGLQRPGWLAVGVLIAAACAFLPRSAVAAVGLAAAAAAIAVWGLHGLTELRNGVHETNWSVTFGGWVYVAGVTGIARRSPLLAAGVGGWVLAAVLYAAHDGYAGALFWAELAPATPGIALLLSALALLVPRLRAAPSPDPAR
jgi:hypothetical protein